MAGKYRTLAIAAGMAVLASVAGAFVQDPSILIDKALNSPVLTVKYKGASVSIVELKINGVSFNARSVSDRANSGETQFTLDTAALIDGDNLIEVCLYDASGKLVGTQRTKISADRRTDSPVFLEGIKSGSTVTGPVEIKVGLRREFKNMYVSFFVNDEFKTLKNFPPYSYLWDSTRVENGWYDLEAWIVDENNSTFRTPKTRVYVNNPGGRTERRTPEQNKTEAPVDTTGMEATPKTAKPAVLTVMLDPIWAKVSQMSGTRSAGIAPGIATGPKSLTPTGARMAAPTQAAAPKAPVAKPAPTVAPKPSDVLPKVTATPAKVEPKAEPKATPIKPEPVKPAVAPKPEPVKPAIAPKPTPTPTPVVAKVTPKAEPAVVSIGVGTRLPEIGTFTILLNSRPVQFDHVLPRVMSGVPLTPFRHLFEQSGGTVVWEGTGKIVQAKGGGKNIVFKIGDKTATINQATYTLELAPFIDRGRSVVPLSFVKDSLDVNVQYDPKTGHVLITAVEK
ncbi:MAG TPA: stalk domain-containing protein [Fimbriimonadaceae bacterium]|nr:stalk domain-containing protein [Fimbriimonadaceae bacterium]HRJ95933.1 stalk domain-containing protein [Fimbriimonadaceae bacterium]